jgi:hypothetical protein
MSILWDIGTGSEVMSRIAAPMLGGQLAAVSRPYEMLSCPIPVPRVGQLMADCRYPRAAASERASGPRLQQSSRRWMVDCVRAPVQLTAGSMRI